MKIFRKLCLLALSLAIASPADAQQTNYTVRQKGAVTVGNCVKWAAANTVQDAGSTCGSGSGTVTTTGSPVSGDIAAFSGASSITSATLGNTITNAGGVLNTTTGINNQGTGTSYTVLSSDMGLMITHNPSSAAAVTLPQAGTTGFGAGKSFIAMNFGTADVTYTPTTSNINGATSLPLPPLASAFIVSDGTNWRASIMVGNLGSLAYITGSSTLGTNMIWRGTGDQWQVFAGGSNAAFLHSFAFSDATSGRTPVWIEGSTSSTSINLLTGGIFAWSNQGTNNGLTKDTGISRLAAKIIGVGNGTQNDRTGFVYAAGWGTDNSGRAVNTTAAASTITIAASISSTYIATPGAAITVTLAAPISDGERRRIVFGSATTVTWTPTSPATTVTAKTAVLAGEAVELVYSSAAGTPTNATATTWYQY